MTASHSHPLPPARTVLREQIRVVALSLRLPTFVAAAFLAVATVLIGIDFFDGKGGVDFAPELSMIPAVAGLLLPIGAWRGEERFGASFLWTLPVDRRRIALAKVFAGWTCLMAAIAVFVLWLLVIALVTGGHVLGEQTIQLLPAVAIPASGTIDAATLQTVRWMPSPLLWLVPFTAGTGTYLLASALALGTRHPIRWIVGVIIGCFFMSALGAAAHSDWLKLAPANLVNTVHAGRYGLDALFTARTESLKTQTKLAGGATVEVWRAVPQLAHWAVASLLWIGVGLVAVSGAASRHRETR